MAKHKNPACRQAKSLGGELVAPVGDMTAAEFSDGGCAEGFKSKKPRRQKRGIGGILSSIAAPVLGGLVSPIVDGIGGMFGSLFGGGRQQPQQQPQMQQMQQYPQQMPQMQYPQQMPYQGEYNARGRRSRQQPRFKEGGSVLARMRKR